MKRLGFAICAAFALFTMPTLFAAKHKASPISGGVFVSNYTGKHVVVKWQTSLSHSMQSRIHMQAVGPAARNEQATSGVEWFKDDTKGQKNDYIYTIHVQVFTENEKTLMSEQTFKKTISMSKLFGRVPHDNLYISVESNYSTQIAIE